MEDNNFGYFRELTLYKPRKVTPYTGETDATKPNMETITIKFDGEFFRDLLDEVHKKMDKLKREGFVPKYVLMSAKAYEQMLVYNFNISGDASPKIVFGVTPIIAPDFDTFQIQIVCEAYDECVFVEELSKLRYLRD